MRERQTERERVLSQFSAYHWWTHHWETFGPTTTQLTEACWDVWEAVPGGLRPLNKSTSGRPNTRRCLQISHSEVHRTTHIWLNSTRASPYRRLNSTRASPYRRLNSTRASPYRRLSSTRASPYRRLNSTRASPYRRQRWTSRR